MKHAERILNILMFTFLYAPLLVMMFFSFNASSSTSVFTGFSLKWYAEVFHSSDTMTAVGNTMLLAFTSATLATVLGVIASLSIFRMKSKAATQTMMTVTNIPMMNPDIVTGVSLMLLFVFAGRLLGFANSLSFWTLLIAHTTFNLPYVILNVLPKLRQADKNLYNAALDLGCTPRQVFFKVTLPNIRPSVVAGWVMAFTLSLDDFVISYYTNGASFQTLPLKIFAMTKKTVKPDMYALSTMIFVTILALLIISNLLQLRAEKQTQRSK